MQPHSTAWFLSAATNLPWSTRAAGVAAATVSLVLLWFIANPYRGITHDAVLYTFQAWARIHPHLSGDVFLRFGSQDAYTLFTPLFANLIDWVGLHPATVATTCLSQALLWYASWRVALSIMPSRLAWLGASSILVISVYYGSLQIFEVVEQFASPRPFAEACSLIALALHLAERRGLAYLSLLAGFAMHPLMAFPAFLVLLVMEMPSTWLRPVAVGGATIGTSMVLIAQSFELLPVVDEAWLEVIRTRSYYLFIDEWLLSDWQQVSAALSGCTFLAVLHESAAVRKLALGVVLVGLAGLALTGLTSTPSPVSIILQGQPWRWMWLASILALLALPNSIRLLKETSPRLWLACSVLLLLGTLLPAMYGLLSLCALAVWRFEKKVSARSVRMLFWASIFVACICAVWTVALGYNYATLGIDLGRDPASVVRLRNVFNSGLAAFTILGIVWASTVLTRSLTIRLAALTVALAVSIGSIPDAMARWIKAPDISADLRNQLAPWRERIPLNGEVLWFDSPEGVWLLLDRQSYVSDSQAAGVVFSRATALELARRAENLKPWTGEFMFARDHDGGGVGALTAQTLAAICQDDQLDFVIAQPGAGVGVTVENFNKLRAAMTLYDCVMTRRP